MSRKRRNKKSGNVINTEEVSVNSASSDNDAEAENVTAKEQQKADEVVQSEECVDKEYVSQECIAENNDSDSYELEKADEDYEQSEFVEYYEDDSDNIADYAEDEYYAEENGDEFYPDEFEEDGIDYSLSRDGSFGAFVKEFFGHIRDIVSNHKIIFVAFLAVIIITIVIVIVINKNSNNSGANVSANEIGSASINSAMFIPQDSYEENAYPAVNELVAKYLTAKQEGDIDTVRQVRNFVSASEEIKIQVLSQYIDSYQNINCYTKIGPYENSYVVYVYCELKLKDYDVLSPYLITLLVCSNDDGSMYIYSGDFDTNVASYIYEISSQDDVKDLFSRVNTEYADILANNPEFAEYKTAMKDMVKEEVAARLAELAVVSSNEVDDSVSENEAEETVTEDSVTEATFEVRATTTVNVRVSDSEDADKIDMLSSGTVVTCYAQQPNGWSKIDFEGQTGFVKTEYLERVDAGNDNAAATNGTTVRCNDTVNIRESASTNADSLGVAYVGDIFTLVEELSNGWSKILYNGSEAYVKSEFLE